MHEPDERDDHDHDDIVADQPDGWHVTEALIVVQFPKQVGKMQAARAGSRGAG